MGATAARSLAGLAAAAVIAAGCVDGGERARPGDPEATVPSTVAATTTFETLPPVDTYVLPTDPDTVIAQIVADDGSLGLPLLTVYGDGRTISVEGEQWLQGTLSAVELQDFFAAADEVGLLDGALVLRGPQPDDQADVTVFFAVDGGELLHELDLSRIERPIPLRSFLVNASSFNYFDLTEPFEPASWVDCIGTSCRITAERDDAGDRPVLPHEEGGDVASAPTGS